MPECNKTMNIFFSKVGQQGRTTAGIGEISIVYLFYALVATIDFF